LKVVTSLGTSQGSSVPASSLCTVRVASPSWRELCIWTGEKVGFWDSVLNAFVMFLLVLPLYIVYDFACLLRTKLLLRSPRLLRTVTSVLDRLHCVNHISDPPTNHPDDHHLLQGQNSLAHEQNNAKLKPLATSLGEMNSDSYMDLLAYAACIQNAKALCARENNERRAVDTNDGTAAGERLNVADWYYRHFVCFCCAANCRSSTTGGDP
jgi:hypothetical protein